MVNEGTVPPLKILYLEDDLVSVEMVRSIFEEERMKAEILHVYDRASYVEGLRTPDLQLIISDFNLPDIDGFEALSLRRELRPEIPFIFVSGTLGEHTAVETLKRGATDFVLKDALMRLPSVITRAVEEFKEHRLRQMAEEKIRFLSEAISQSPVAIEIRNDSGAFFFANRQLSDLSRYSSEELRLMEAHALYREATPPETLMEIDRCRQSRQPWSGELVMIRKDGSFRQVRGVFSPMNDPKGGAGHSVAVYEDMTEWKEELQKRQDLEKQLLQAQKMEAIGSLAGGIAHDFNNILTAIIGFAELSTLSLPEGSEDASNVRHIMLAGRRAKDLVSQILSFSRMQESSMAIIDVSHTVTDILRLLRATLPSTIEIVRQLEPGLILGNPIQIHQVLMNLCTNAEHAMRGRTGRLSIRVRTLNVGEGMAAELPPLQAGPHVCLSISDTGHGMDPATQERIFERYFTTKKAGEGSGLGLSVVLSIVQNHKGAIRVNSRPGSGTTFDVFFPASKSTGMEEDRQSVPAIAGRGRTVFILDDEISILTFLGIRLQRMGFVTKAFRVPSEVEQALLDNREHADLLFTDQTMPGMTGANLIRSLRSQGCEIPAILSSGYGSELRPGEFSDIADVTKIDKPFTEDSLNIALYKALG